MSGAVAVGGDRAIDPRSEVRFDYRGRGDELLALFLKNFLLTLVTLGLYFPWARTEVLRYAISHVWVDGDPLEYRGTGGELFKGLLVAVLIYAGVLAVLVGISVFLPVELQAIVVFGFYVALLVLAAVAMFGSFRYRVTRTSWRGIRFAFHGERGQFVKDFLVHSLLVAVTLGLGAPLFVNWRREALTIASAFGTRSFDYDGVGKQLMKPFVIAVLLTLPTLGLIWFWYDGRLKKHLWNSTTFEGARFQLAFEGDDWFRFQLGNLALVLITLGIASPWVLVRQGRYLADHLRLVGPVDWAAIRQEAQSAAPATGEGLAEVFDVDVGLS